MLGAASVTRFLDTFAQAAAHATAAFVPEGLFLTGILGGIGLIFFCVSWYHGERHVVGGGLRLALSIGGTVWMIRNWPYLAGLALSGARAGIGVLVGGYDSPTTLFDMAIGVFQRIIAEAAGAASWNPYTWWNALVMALAGLLVLVAVALPGVLAFAAEMQLMLGACIAPLVLPMIAVPFTSHIGFGALRFIILGALRVIVMGLVSYLVALTATALVTLPGADQTLDGTQLGALSLMGLVGVVVAWTAGKIAAEVLYGAVGSLGLSDAISAGAAALGAASLGGAAAAAAGKGAVATAAGAVSGASWAYDKVTGGGESRVTSSPGSGTGTVGKSAFD